MDIKIIIIAGSLVLLVLLFARYKRTALVPFIFALLVATAWTSYYRYEYVNGNIFLFDQINVYPLILWTIGLTTLQLVHVGIKRRYGTIVTVILYLTVLATLEAIGYHVLGIRLVTNYTSLLGLGVIHAPPIMKVFYVLAGPAFVLLMRVFRFEKRAMLRLRGI